MMRTKQLVMFTSLLLVCSGLYWVWYVLGTVNEHQIHIEEHAVGEMSKLQLNFVEGLAGGKGAVVETSKKTVTDVGILNTSKEQEIRMEDEIAVVAKKISMAFRTVMVTMVNDAYLPFTYSWLCNTKTMGIHKSVLIITTDKISKDNLTRDWPEISVVAMDLPNSGGDQAYSHVGYVKIMIKRTEMLLSIVMADVEMFLFEVDCLWFDNPVPQFHNLTGYDILVNPVSGRETVYAGGFLYLYATDKAKALWKKLTEQMINLGVKISKFADTKYISESDNDQQYLSALITSRYGGITIKELSLTDYPDGKWYELTEDDKKKTRPYVVNNNWVIGNKNKIERAKKFKHWFIHDDLTCDMELVNKTVYI